MLFFRFMYTYTVIKLMNFGDKNNDVSETIIIIFL